MCDTENYTIRVDSLGALSNTSFIGYLNIPLKNVVRAELQSVSIHGNAASLSTGAIYVHIDELESKFTDRTSLRYDQSVAGKTSNTGVTPSSTISNIGLLNTALVAIPVTTGASETRTIFTSGSYFPVEVTYIEPIRRLDKFTVNLYAENGSQPTITSGPTFLTLRLTCAKPNVCLYPN